MINKYQVTADVDSPKFGKGQLVAYLGEAEFAEYEKLSDAEKLAFLKEKGAEFRADISQVEEADVANFQVQSDQPTPEAKAETATPADAGSDAEPKIIRKMRINIDGNDTGWIDVNDETEEQYNQLMDRFNDMQREFDDRFNKMFESAPRGFFDFAKPLLGNWQAEDRKQLENKEANKEENK